jgi:asparagine synthase (glutamine-hydrolysing)
MCGLACVIRTGGDEALPVARDMLRRARHRGPDAEGLCRVDVGPGMDLAMSHARLAILGRGPQGAQPFVRGPITLVYNGEIYNFRALRDELESQGVRFGGDGDTEVVAAAWEAWGPEALSRLDGMFALVLWDARSQRVVAARDAFAIKPLHMLRTGRGMAWASEIKQFRALPEWRPRADPEMLGAFLAMGLHDTDPVRTFFTDVERVEPGTWIEVRLEGGRPSPPVVHRFASAGQVPGVSVRNRVEAIELVRREVLGAVDDHLVSEVPVGSCASGGTDSSIVVAAACRRLGRGLDLFHARTAVQGMDELSYVRALAARTGSRVHVVDITPDAVRGAFEEVVASQDEPFSDASVIAQWLLMRRARQEGVPVLLDGQGADEMFMGYAKYQFHHLQDLLRSGRMWPMALHMLRLLASGEHGGARLWSKMHRYLPRALRTGATLPLPPGLPGSSPAWESWRSSRPSADQVARRDVTQWSLPLLLRYEDRNSMAHGVEARVPYVCWRVMRAARAIDPALHVQGGRVKSLLREAFAQDLPVEISRRRTRLGFVTAWGRWVEEGENLERWSSEGARAGIRAIFRTTGSAGGGVFDPVEGSSFPPDVRLRLHAIGAWLVASGVGSS